jgi:glycine dehydrogenase subunit 1
VAHPYMANSAPGVAEEMLAQTGYASLEELFAQIPAGHRTKRPLQLPDQLGSEAALRRHLTGVLACNTSCEEALSFLGAGMYRHYVPAICDEIASRHEWLTSVWGTPASDQGRFQAWFEYSSQLGELLDLDFVGLPVYSWGCAAGHALRMAARITGRSKVLVPCVLDPERRAVIGNYCGSAQPGRRIEIETIGFGPDGRLDLADLQARLSGDVAAVYVENPNYFGVIEDQIEDVVAAATAAGAEVIAGVDPLSLGVLAPPGELGVGLAVGTVQTLGVHLNGGGGAGGFIASRDEERYAREYPTLQVSICDTTEPGERGYGIPLFAQTSYGAREEGNDWTGNSVYLWAIASAAYMAVMGPAGFAEIGAAVLQRGQYAASRIAALPGLSVRFGAAFFREFVVDFSATGKPVAEIDRGLRQRGIFGGADLSRAFPELGSCALYCVTETHTQSDIDRLADALTEVIR